MISRTCWNAIRGDDRCGLDRCRSLGNEVHARDRPVSFLSHLDELRLITEGEMGLTLGAGVSYTEAYPVIALATIPPTDRALEPHRRRAGSQHGDCRRQRRQWLANRRYAAALIALARQFNCARARAPRRPAGGIFHRIRQTGSPPGEFVEAMHVPYRRKQRSLRASTRFPSAGRRHFVGHVAAFRLVLVKRSGGDPNDRIWRHGRNAEAGKGGRSNALTGSRWTEETIERAVDQIRGRFHPADGYGGRRRNTACLLRSNLLRRFFRRRRRQAPVRITRSVAAWGGAAMNETQARLKAPKIKGGVATNQPHDSAHKHVTVQASISTICRSPPARCTGTLGCRQCRARHGP